MRIRIIKVGRDATSGRFISQAEARLYPTLSVIETYRVVPRCARGERVKRSAKAKRSYRSETVGRARVARLTARRSTS